MLCKNTSIKGVALDFKLLTLNFQSKYTSISPSGQVK